MSGPKSDSYSVRAQANREALKRARNRAGAQLSELEKTHQKIADLANRFSGENLGIDLSVPPEPPVEATFSQLESYRQKLQDLCHEREAALVSTETRIKTRRVLGALAGTEVGIIQKVGDLDFGTVDSGSLPPGRSDSQSNQLDHEAVQEKLERKLAKLDAMVEAKEREKIDSIISRIRSTGSVQKTGLLLQEISRCVGQANRQAAIRRQNRDEARELLEKLGSLPGPEVEKARIALQRVEAGTHTMTAHVRKMAAKAVESGKCQYANKVLNEVLENMGYEIEEEFQTLFADGGTIFFSRPAWKEYSVSLRVSPKDSSLNYHIVREEQGGLENTREQALRDKEMEESWCSEFSDLQGNLKEAGLVCRSKRHIPAGQMAVQVRKVPASHQKNRRRHDEVSPAKKERKR